MTIQHDDPKLTAYALGEGSPEEKHEVEEALKADPSLRVVIEEIRTTGALLSAELKKEKRPGLGKARIKALEKELFRKSRPRFLFPFRVWAAAAATAVIVLAIYIPMSQKYAKKSKTNIAMLEKGKELPFGPETSTSGAVSRVVEGDGLRDEGRRGRNIRPRADASAGLSKAYPYIGGGRRGLGVPGDGRAVGPGALANVEGRESFRSQSEPFNTESYDYVSENPFLAVGANPLSTFSIDVDTASYANMRRFIQAGSLPPKDSVRIEEWINYFTYDYASPTGEHPFATHVEIASAPWAPKHRLVRVGLKGREIPMGKRPATNLVFLIDVSGSMQSENKLPLVRKSLRLLVEQLSEKDNVALAVYAGASGLVLPPTECGNKSKILEAIDRLEAGGSTNGASGIQLAYDTAVQGFIKGGVNRVILATDGDFNVGMTNQGDLIRLIEEKAKTGVYLSVLGFGMGNYKDSTLEKLADKGNGNYAYIDTLNEARKVLAHELGSTLVTIAKDVKVQVEFNPAQVQAYRLIGYENRMLRAEDFKDDTKDAGELGAGHTVTALYEVVPNGVSIDLPGVDPLKYQAKKAEAKSTNNGELLTVKLRYKKPDGDKSIPMKVPVSDTGKAFENASPDFRFVASVASFGMLLRDSKFKGEASFDAVAKMAEAGQGKDPYGYRSEFLSLVKKAKQIQ